MQGVFDTLKTRNLISRRGEISVRAIDALTSSQIVKLAETVLNTTEPEEPKVVSGTFTHSASGSLAGGRGGSCAGLTHRLESIERLARFAVMYSDRVYIENFFSGYAHLASYMDEDELKEALYDDLQALLALKPLLENQYVRFFTPNEHWCRDCLLPVYGVAKKRLDAARRQLSTQYLQKLSAKVVHLDDVLCEIEYAAPEPFMPHPLIWKNGVNCRDLHEIINQMPRTLKKITNGESPRLSKTTMKKMELHSFCANRVADSAAYGVLTANTLKASFLTDSTLDLSFLQSITKDQKENSYLEKRNQTALKHLTSIVPFVADVSIANLIKIRKREEEAFIIYRRALNEVIDNYKSNSSSFSEKDARALYSDVIAPGLAALNQSVKAARRDLTSKAYRSIIAVVGAISFGLYTGLIPTQWAEMVKVVGFTQIAKDVFEKLLPSGDATETIKTEDLYFLWQVKKLRK